MELQNCTSNEMFDIDIFNHYSVLSFSVTFTDTHPLPPPLSLSLSLSLPLSNCLYLSYYFLLSISTSLSSCLSLSHSLFVSSYFSICLPRRALWSNFWNIKCNCHDSCLISFNFTFMDSIISGTDSFHSYWSSQFNSISVNNVNRWLSKYNNFRYKKNTIIFTIKFFFRFFRNCNFLLYNSLLCFSHRSRGFEMYKKGKYYI